MIFFVLPHSDIFLSFTIEFLSFVTIKSILVFFLSKLYFLSFVTIGVFEFCHNLNFWVFSHILSFEFGQSLSFMTLWVFEFVTIGVSKFYQKFNFWVLLQFEFLSFVAFWVYEFFSSNLSFQHLSQYDFFSFSQFFVVTHFVLYNKLCFITIFVSSQSWFHNKIHKVLQTTNQQIKQLADKQLGFYSFSGQLISVDFIITGCCWLSPPLDNI